MAFDYSTLPTKRSASGVLFTRDDDTVLLVEPVYKPDWEVPGGTVELNESPRAAAIREVGEELGLTITPGRLLIVDWVPPRDTRTEGVMFLFTGGELNTAAIHLPPEELRSWAWCSPEEAEARASPLLARRIRAALTAHATGGSLYCEDGVPV
ncbi:NUDIX domain-containing protein [Cryptosporangium sp. NPDC048952]|uniref:NUDIX domain-containing protein n=1 Tax=Cryptosporangium sp. NPDC048952 TaxID=3363961 RepID=UPI00371678B1